MRPVRSRPAQPAGALPPGARQLQTQTPPQTRAPDGGEGGRVASERPENQRAQPPSLGLCWGTRSRQVGQRCAPGRGPTWSLCHQAELNAGRTEENGNDEASGILEGTTGEAQGLSRPQSRWCPSVRRQDGAQRCPERRRNVEVAPRPQTCSHRPEAAPPWGQVPAGRSLPSLPALLPAPGILRSVWKQQEEGHSRGLSPGSGFIAARRLPQGSPGWAGL